MTSAPSSGTLIAILPCNDLDASERFYNRLGFVRRVESVDPDYRILSNGAGGHLHLTSAEKGWLMPGRNPFRPLSSISKMSTVWPLRYRTYAREDADQRTSPGECMNLHFLTRMRRACARRLAVSLPTNSQQLSSRRSVLGTTRTSRSLLRMSVHWGDAVLPTLRSK